ncbi:MAG: hypothetical protein ACRCVW_00115 [Brevinema sp.]
MIEQINKLIRQKIAQKAFPVLATISKIYSSKNEYFVDCKELSNEKEETKTIYTRVPLPKYWGTKNGGIWMTPSVGSTGLISFLNGDKNFPIITNILESGHEENHKENSLLIKIGDISLTIDDSQIILKSQDKELIVSDKITINSGQSEINLSDKIAIKNNFTTLKSILEAITDDLPQVTCPVSGAPSSVMPSINSVLIKNKINMLMS